MRIGLSRIWNYSFSYGISDSLKCLHTRSLSSGGDMISASPGLNSPIPASSPSRRSRGSRRFRRSPISTLRSHTEDCVSWTIPNASPLHRQALLMYPNNPVGISYTTDKKPVHSFRCVPCTPALAGNCSSHLRRQQDHMLSHGESDAVYSLS